MNKNKEDEWLWKREDNIQYIIRLTYKKLRNEVRGEEEEVYSKLWRIKTLPLT